MSDSTLTIIYLSLILTVLSPTHPATAQMVSKRCSNCNKEVSSGSEAGNRCPHCGVLWSKESKSGTWGEATVALILLGIFGLLAHYMESRKKSK